MLGKHLPTRHRFAGGGGGRGKGEEYTFLKILQDPEQDLIGSEGKWKEKANSRIFQRPVIHLRLHADADGPLLPSCSKKGLLPHILGFCVSGHHVDLTSRFMFAFPGSWHLDFFLPGLWGDHCSLSLWHLAMHWGGGRWRFGSQLPLRAPATLSGLFLLRLLRWPRGLLAPPFQYSRGHWGFSYPHPPLAVVREHTPPQKKNLKKR